MVQGLKHCASKVGSLGSIHGQEVRSHTSQLRAHRLQRFSMLQLRHGAARYITNIFKTEGLEEQIFSK